MNENKQTIPKTKIQLNRGLYYLDRAPRIGLLSHVKTDGDALGTQLALAHGLRAHGKHVTCINMDVIPQKLQFLPGVETVKRPQTREEIVQVFRECDVFVALDTGSYELTGLQKFGIRPKDIPIPFINIDHHPDNSGFGFINIVISDASSTAEIIGYVLDALNIPITPDIGTCLLLGIFNDTDSFKNTNVTRATLELTSRLIASGAQMKAIVANFLQDKTVNTMQLWGEILSRVHENKEFGVVSAVVTKEDINKYGATPEDLEGIVNFLNSIPEARAALVLSEREEGQIKGSLRTLHEDVDVSRLAREFGGGGHKKAAGFTLPGRLVQEGKKWYIQDVQKLAHASVYS